MRSSLIAVLVVSVLGCAPEFDPGDVQDASLFAEPLPPRAPSTELDAQRAQKSNRARALWLSQEDARLRVWHVKGAEARRGLEFLRFAGHLAGGVVRAGALTQERGSTWSFKPGGDELHVVTETGDVFSVRVISLEGDLLADAFPLAGESLKTEVTLPDGRGWVSEIRGEVAEQGVKQVRTICSGVFGGSGGEQQFRADVDVIDRRSFETFTRPYATRSAIEAVIEASIERVRLSGTENFVNCSDSAHCPARWERHDLSSELDGVTVTYTRAQTNVEANAPAKVEWSGTIARDDQQVGSFDKRSFTTNRVSLDLTFEGERYGTKTVYGN